MKSGLFISFLLCFFHFSALAAPQSLSYQGRILDSSSNPLENASVVFRFTLLSPDGTCELWTETKSAINMINSGGIFDLTIGPSAGLATALENGTNHTCLNSGNYTGTATAGRQLKVEFNPGSTGWREITPNLTVNSVPYASVAAKLGNMTAGDFIARPGTCASGQSVYFDGTNFVCQALVAGDIPDIDAAKITTGTLTRDVLSTNVSATNGQFTHLRIFDGASQYLTMNYPSAGASSYTIRWPVTQGGASTVLQNDGAGNLSWSAAGGSGNSTQLQGRAVSATLPLDGQALVWDNGLTTWRPDYIRAQDLRNAWGGSQMIPATACTSGQSMTWSVITDAFTCQAIELNASAITAGTINTARLGSGTADNTTFLRGDGSWQSVGGGAGDITQGGNTFGAALTIGTNDNFGLNLEINNDPALRIGTTGEMSFGRSSEVAAPTPNVAYRFGRNPYDQIGDYANIENVLNHNGGANTGTIVGQRNNVITQFDTRNVLIANENIVQQFGLSINEAVGAQNTFLASIFGTATPVTSVLASGSKNIVQNSNANHTLTTANALFADVIVDAGTITNSRGLYIDALDGSNRWGIYQAGGSDNNYFAGNVGIGREAPSTLLHIGSGSSGPQDGSANVPLHISQAGNTALSARNTSSNTEWGGGVWDSYGYSGTLTASDYRLITSDQGRLTISASGSVGIPSPSSSALLQLGDPTKALGTFRLAGDTSGYVQIQPASAAGSWTMTLPINDGDANQVLATNGSGVTSWVTVPSSGVCTAGSTAYTAGTPINFTCTGVPASTEVAVNCSPDAALAGYVTARSTGTVNQIAITIGVSATYSMTCMWMTP